MRPKKTPPEPAPKSILGFGLKQINGSPQKLIVVDTNILVEAPDAVEVLQDNGTNGVVLAPTVLNELDNLKRKSELAGRIGSASRSIVAMMDAGDPNLYVAQGDVNKFPDLDPSNNDHHIIAALLTIKQQYPKMPLVLVTNDTLMYVFAKSLGVNVQEYRANRVDTSILEHPLIHVEIPDSMPVGEMLDWPPEDLHDDAVPENGGVVLNNDGNIHFACIREGNKLRAIRSDISAAGVVPYTIDANNTNWEMYLALEQLLNPRIVLVTLIGQAGTGKTLAAIASAIHQRRRYKKIMITRPFVPLGGGKDLLGTVPGDVEDKSAPWLQPIYDNLDFLGSLGGDNKKIISMLRNGQSDTDGCPCRLEVLSFGHLRGRSLNDVFLIVDEAQNIDHSDMLALITRMGQGSKVILAGDIEQVDIFPRDKRVNALAHVALDMMGQTNCSTTYLVEQVRSYLAFQAAMLLRRR